MKHQDVPHADEQAFSAPVVKLGINFCVEVPEAIVRSLLAAARKRAAPVQVSATANGRPFDTNVVRYSGACRVYLNGPVRTKIGGGAGDTVHITLRYDPAQRMPPMPDELKQALAEREQARAAWRLQPSSRRKEILAYLHVLKTMEARDRAVQRVLHQLERKTISQRMSETANGQE